nr:hypothetical protein [Acidimicrobiia bacterium]
RHRRHGRLEGVVLGGVGRNTSQLELLYPEVQKEADLRFAITTLGHFSDWLSERCMVPDWVAPQIKAWLEERNELPSVLSAPSGLDALVDLVWAGDMIGAEHWAKHRKAEFQQRLAPIDGITNNSAAMSAINGYLDKLTKIASRLDSGLDRALRRYQELRVNRLGRNEPST